MLQESMDEIKEENYMDIVTDEYSILVKTDEEDVQPTVSGQKSQSEVNLFVDEVVGVCASVCIFFLQVIYNIIFISGNFHSCFI
jgi:hypothetical protein